MPPQPRDLDTRDGQLTFCINELGHVEDQLEVLIGYLWYEDKGAAAAMLVCIGEALKEVTGVIERIQLHQGDQTESVGVEAGGADGSRV